MFLGSTVKDTVSPQSETQVIGNKVKNLKCHLNING